MTPGGIARAARRIIFLCIALSIAATPAPVMAWGPIARLSIVTTAAHILSQQHEIRLVRLESYIQEGAKISETDLLRLFPNSDINPIGAIEREIYLLQTVRSDRVDPYYAYRLGALGQIVAIVSAPMAAVEPSIRSDYFRDVERNIQFVEMKTSDRVLVDPQAYFLLVQRQASTQNDTIEVDYQSGEGFSGLARAMLDADTSRAVDAVADVWYTIFVQDVEHINVSQADVRDFSLQALEYYLGRDKLREASEMYTKVTTLGMMTPDLRKSIGDAYFDTGHFEEAIKQYRAVLAEAPSRRDVIIRISGYFEVVGDSALLVNRLEDARDAYAAALEADALSLDAQRKLQETEARIFSRDERLMAARVAILAARDLEVEAENAGLNSDYAQAISLLRDASSRYGSVSREFPAESKAAVLGQKNVELRISEFKGELIRSAQRLSGSGSANSAKYLVKAQGGLTESALHEMLEAEYSILVRVLGDTLGERFRLGQ